MTARLNAINSCLAGIGITPVDSEDEADSDVASASAAIDRVTEEFLGAGWWFNREENWKLAPETETNEIPLSASVMQIEPAGLSRCKNLVMRSRKVYDMDLHTFKLQDSVEDDGYLYFTFIQNISFEDIPPLVRAAIVSKARRVFAQDSEVDSQRWNFQIRDEQEAMRHVLIEEARSHKGNYFRDNPTAAGHLAMIGGSNGGTGTITYTSKRSSY